MPNSTFGVLLVSEVRADLRIMDAQQQGNGPDVCEWKFSRNRSSDLLWALQGNNTHLITFRSRVHHSAVGNCWDLTNIFSSAGHWVFSPPSIWVEAKDAQMRQTAFSSKLFSFVAFVQNRWNVLILFWTHCTKMMIQSEPSISDAPSQQRWTCAKLSHKYSALLPML